MSLDLIDPYPWFVNKPIDLKVNDQPIHVRITASQWTDFWRPFLARLLEMWKNAYPKRFIVAIAGPPGSGKSVFSEQLQWLVTKGFFHKKAASHTLPMDGFHYSNDYLESHKRKLPDGSEIPLAWVKGQPDTIDIPSLRRHLELLIQRPAEVAWPGYSRYTHDILPHLYRIHEPANLLFVEGNYLLLNAGPFKGITSFFDLKIYLDAPAAGVLSNLMDRHMRGGKSVEQAKEWVKRIDLPNARIAESTRANADLIIERNIESEISAMHWRPNPIP